MLDIHSTLESTFGFSTFRAGQEEVITRIIEGKSSLAVFPTGSGKSLCYQLPAIMLPGLTLVVSPLIALMKDQVEGLQRLGIQARNLDSTLTSEEVFEVFDLMKNGVLKVLFVAPERFTNPSFLNRLKKTNISLLAIDEAHCISEWGHAFRPDYLKIAQAAQSLGITLKLALTATATPKVSEDICKSFQIKKENFIQTGFKRPNLSLHISQVKEEDRDEALLKKLLTHEGQSTIIYVTRQMTTEHLTTYIKKSSSLKVRSYHAGMSSEKRAEIQEEFMSGGSDIIVATIAFGMGIDKANIRYVYHYNLPKSFENYVQETGRAGRDGKPSECHLLACESDLRTLENFIYTKRPSQSAIESLVYACLSSPEVVALNRYNLSISFDIKTEVIQTILVWLELGGYVKSTGWRHGTYDITLLRKMDQIFAGHSDERQVFLKTLFLSCKKNSRNPNKYKCIVEEVATAMNEDAGKVSQSLQWLETHGDIALKPSQYLMLYQAAEQGLETSKKKVTEEIEQHFAHWEEMELGRLDQIIDLIESPDCIEGKILSYFGEESEPCGKCSSCLSERTQKLNLAAKNAKELATQELQLIRGLHKESHSSLRAPRQMAKFLCGQTSPATTKERLTTKHEDFGVFQDYPFEDVLLNCEVVIGK